MKIFTRKGITQKLIISILCCIMLFNFCFQTTVKAQSFGGGMMELMIDFATAIADVAASLVQLGVTGEWHYAVEDKGSGKPEGSEYWIDEDKFQYPVLQVSPELIFANKIEFLDANFITGGAVKDDYIVNLKDDTPLKTLRNIVASWYVTLRTIAIVGLLSVLIYIGIKIIISSVGEKAKYKERIIDWVIAFCLLFFMHYIMAAGVTVVDKISNMLGDLSNVTDGIDIDPQYGTVEPNVGTAISTSKPGGLLDTNWEKDENREGAISKIRDAIGKDGATIEFEVDWICTDDQGWTKKYEYEFDCDKYTVILQETDQTKRNAIGVYYHEISYDYYVNGRNRWNTELFLKGQ